MRFCHLQVRSLLVQDAEARVRYTKEQISRHRAGGEQYFYQILPPATGAFCVSSSTTRSFMSSSMRKSMQIA